MLFSVFIFLLYLPAYHFQSCDPTCLTCSGSGLTSCTSCNSPALLSSGSCVCPIGTYGSPSSCANCKTGCNSCTSATTCQICQPGYLYSSSNFSCTLIPIISSPSASSCTVGKYYNITTNGCVNCSNNCLQCNAGTNCTYCNASFGVTQGGCAPVQPNSSLSPGAIGGIVSAIVVILAIIIIFVAKKMNSRKQEIKHSKINPLPQMTSADHTRMTMEPSDRSAIQLMTSPAKFEITERDQGPLTLTETDAHSPTKFSAIDSEQDH